MSTVFLTGFPGFLGSRLVGVLLDRYSEDVTITCLVQEKYRSRAERRMAKIAHTHGTEIERVDLVTGDITEPDLAMGAHLRPLQREVTEIYHLAAVYDLGVSREVAQRVNVDGTKHLLHVADGCPNLRRFQYVSTCYVSGRYGGIFTEKDLQKGQSFNNHYEASKYQAEVKVQQQMKQGLPATIYRPSIVVGDAETGATQKYDGPYPIIRWLLDWQDIVPMPSLGDPARYTVNVVPRDFVTNAIAHLSGLEESEGKVYQLCDPHAPTVEEFLDILARATNRRLFYIPVPSVLARLALDYVPGLAEWTGLPSAALDYFTHPTSFTCQHVHEDLKGTGIACPPFAAYAHRLVDFVRQHPDIRAKAMA